MPDTDTSPSAETEDFGTSLRRRLRGYSSGILGNLGALDGVAVTGRAADAASGIVARSAEFGGSLQSLLSQREVTRTTAQRREMPALGGQAPTDGEGAEQAEEASPREEPEAPRGPITFGSDEWFARMRQRVASTTSAQASYVDSSTPSMDAINAAYGGPPGGPAADGGPLRRRSRVQEGGASVALPSTQPVDAESVGTVPSGAEMSPSSQPEAASEADASSNLLPPQRRSTAVAPESAAEAPRVAAPIVQRRRGRDSRLAPAGEPAAAAPGETSPAREGVSSTAESITDAPVTRRLVEATSTARPAPSPAGRVEARRITPVPQASFADRPVMPTATAPAASPTAAPAEIDDTTALVAPAASAAVEAPGAPVGPSRAEPPQAGVSDGPRAVAEPPAAAQGEPPALVDAPPAANATATSERTASSEPAATSAPAPTPASAPESVTPGERPTEPLRGVPEAPRDSGAAEIARRVEASPPAEPPAPEAPGTPPAGAQRRAATQPPPGDSPAVAAHQDAPGPTAEATPTAQPSAEASRRGAAPGPDIVRRTASPASPAPAPATETPHAAPGSPAPAESLVDAPAPTADSPRPDDGDESAVLRTVAPSGGPGIAPPSNEPTTPGASEAYAVVGDPASRSTRTETDPPPPTPERTGSVARRAELQPPSAPDAPARLEPAPAFAATPPSATAPSPGTAGSGEPPAENPSAPRDAVEPPRPTQATAGAGPAQADAPVPSPPTTSTVARTAGDQPGPSAPGESTARPPGGRDEPASSAPQSTQAVQRQVIAEPPAAGIDAPEMAVPGLPQSEAAAAARDDGGPAETSAGSPAVPANELSGTPAIVPAAEAPATDSAVQRVVAEPGSAVQQEAAGALSVPAGLPGATSPGPRISGDPGGEARLVDMRGASDPPGMGQPATPAGAAAAVPSASTEGAAQPRTVQRAEAAPPQATPEAAPLDLVSPLLGDSGEVQRLAAEAPAGPVNEPSGTPPASVEAVQRTAVTASAAPGQAAAPGALVTPPPVPSLAGLAEASAAPERARVEVASPAGAFDAAVAQPPAGAPPRAELRRTMDSGATPVTSTQPAFAAPLQASAPPAAQGVPVQRAVATPAPMPSPAAVRLDPPAPVIQREQTVPEATGQITGVGTESGPEKPPDFAKIADQVWPHIRRKLRIEREREHGLSS